MLDVESKKAGAMDDDISAIASSVIIRDATPADLDALTALRPPRSLHAERIAPRDAAAAAAADDDLGKRYLLALLDNRPVGFGVIYFRGDPMWDRPDQVPLIMDLWVAENVRRRGIGRRLAADLESAARARGFPCVYLQVRAERNPHVIEMYQRMGYQKLQQRPRKDFYAEIDEQGNMREGEEMILDMQKWL
jgi:ribosomal protein S18 acetylase RimI-like enzyme